MKYFIFCLHITISYSRVIIRIILAFSIFRYIPIILPSKSQKMANPCRSRYAPSSSPTGWLVQPVMTGTQSDWVHKRTGYPIWLGPSRTVLVHPYAVLTSTPKMVKFVVNQTYVLLWSKYAVKILQNCIARRMCIVEGSTVRFIIHFSYLGNNAKILPSVRPLCRDRPVGWQKFWHIFIFFTMGLCQSLNICFFLRSNDILAVM